MTRVLLRISGRKDVVLTLRPGWFEGVTLAPSSLGPVARFSILLLQDEDGVDVTPTGLHVPDERPADVEQIDLLGGAR